MGIRAPMPASVHVLALAHQGCVGEARALGERDLAADESVGFISAVALDLRSLGIAEFMAGDLPAAADHLLRALSISSGEIGISEPAILRLHPDAIVALVALARIDEAAELTGQLDVAHRSQSPPVVDGDGRALPRPAECRHRRAGRRPRAARARPRRSSAAADAVRGGQDAPAAWQRAPASRPPDRRPPRAGGRSRHRSPGWARRSRSGRRARSWPASAAARPDNELTPVEQRIADLVAAGQTNREVAATVFISVRTVESHLGRIYRKLGIRSRTELAARASADLIRRGSKLRSSPDAVAAPDARSVRA